MNELMILGIAIIVIGLIVCLGLYYKICYKNKNHYAYVRFLLFIVLIAFTLLGGYIAQAGADKARLEFTETELAFINSNKLFEDFTDAEKELFAIVMFKYLSNEEEKVTMYDDIILNWAVDQYLSDNSHRPDLTREDAKTFVLNRWKEKREFQNKN